jgi:hypothetical protein
MRLRGMRTKPFFTCGYCGLEVAVGERCPCIDFKRDKENYDREKRAENLKRKDSERVKGDNKMEGD